MPDSPRRLIYLAQQKRRKRAIRLFQIALLAGLFILWELSAALEWNDAFLISSPSRMAETFAALWRSGDLWKHIGTSCLETVVGFTAGTILGTAIAIAMWWSDFLSRVLDPYLVVLNALPKIALGPILIVWFGAGVKSIIIMGLLISLVVTVMTVLAGFNEITGEKQLLMRTLGATKLQILTMVVLPASVPTIMSALKISVGMSWVGVIVGEYLVSRAGLGYLIVYGSQVFKLDLVMASIVILCVLAAAMYYAVAFFEKRLIRWRGHA